MALQQKAVQTLRWTGSQHPTISNITRLMQKEGLRPYMWTNMPNHRYAVRSYGYDKVLYVVEGKLEITFPDFNQRVRMRSGDRIDIRAGIRHGTIVGGTGATCMEATISRRHHSSS